MGIDNYGSGTDPAAYGRVDSASIAPFQVCTVGGRRHTGFPVNADSTDYNLGTVFYTTVPGSITGLRVYAGSSESGDHACYLFNNTTGAVVDLAPGPIPAMTPGLRRRSRQLRSRRAMTIRSLFRPARIPAATTRLTWADSAAAGRSTISCTGTQAPGSGDRRTEPGL
ncbi:DUF4082 domain-containing protein [Paenibacillus sabuli]